MPENRLSSGVLAGDELGLMPCLWLGVEAHAKNVTIPWFPEGRLPDEGAANQYRNRLRPGQYVVEHQYEGTATNHVTLCGAFLPLSTCSDPAIVKGLRSIADKYFDQPFVSWSPNLDELVVIRDELRNLAPLDASTRFRKTAEGFIQFGIDQKAYHWLRKHFQMVSALEDNNDDTRVEVLETQPLPGSRVKDFAAWMAGANGECYESWLSGALVYENSD